MLIRILSEVPSIIFSFRSAHTTHNVDIFMSLFFLQRLRGRVCLALGHHAILLINPWIRMFGFVPGKRELAITLLQRKQHDAVSFRKTSNDRNSNWLSVGGRGQDRSLRAGGSGGNPASLEQASGTNLLLRIDCQHENEHLLDTTRGHFLPCRFCIPNKFQTIA